MQQLFSGFQTTCVWQVPNWKIAFFPDLKAVFSHPPKKVSRNDWSHWRSGRKNDIKTNRGKYNIWEWLKMKQQGDAGFGPCLLLPGIHFGTGFLSHSHIDFSNIGNGRFSWNTIYGPNPAVVVCDLCSTGCHPQLVAFVHCLIGSQPSPKESTTKTIDCPFWQNVLKRETRDGTYVFCAKLSFFCQICIQTDGRFFRLALGREVGVDSINMGHRSSLGASSVFWKKEMPRWLRIKEGIKSFTKGSPLPKSRLEQGALHKFG